MRAPLDMQAREPVFVSVRPRLHSRRFTAPLAVGPGPQGGCAAATSPLGSGPSGPPCRRRVLLPTSRLYGPSGVPSCSLERKRETGDTQDSEAWCQGLAVCLEALRGWQGRRGQRAWPPPPPSVSHLPPPERSCRPRLESASATTGRPVLKGEAKGDRGALSPPVQTQWDGTLLRGKTTRLMDRLLIQRLLASSFSFRRGSGGDKASCTFDHRASIQIWSNFLLLGSFPS